MERLTFTRHTITDGDVRPGIISNQFPWPRFDKNTTIADAGFDPNMQLTIGLLSAPWKGHPQHALIITNDYNRQTGSVIAVSNETLIIA